MTLCRALVLVLTFTVACYLTSACRQTGGCQRGNMAEYLDPQLREAMGQEIAWMSDASLCSAGQYTIIASASGEDPTIYVLQGKQGVFARTRGFSMMFRNG